MAKTVLKRADRLPKSIAAEALEVGHLVYLSASGWKRAVASGTPKAAAYGVVTRGVTDNELAKGVLPEVCSQALITGFSGKTVGAVQYLATGNNYGQTTETRPSSNGYIVQAAGIATAADTIFFNVTPFHFIVGT